MVQRQLDIHTLKKKVKWHPVSHYTKIKSKLIFDLNVRTQTMKLLKENTEVGAPEWLIC